MQTQVKSASTLILNQVLSHNAISQGLRTTLLTSSLGITIWSNACFLLCSNDCFELIQKHQKKICQAIKGTMPWVEIASIRLRGCKAIAFDIPIKYILENKTKDAIKDYENNLLAAAANKDFPCLLINYTKGKISYNYFPSESLSGCKLRITKQQLATFYQEIIEHGCVEGIEINIKLCLKNQLHVMKVVTRGCIVHVKKEASFEEILILQLIGRELDNCYLNL